MTKGLTLKRKGHLDDLIPMKNGNDDENNNDNKGIYEKFTRLSEKYGYYYFKKLWHFLLKDLTLKHRSDIIKEQRYATL